MIQLHCVECMMQFDVCGHFERNFRALLDLLKKCEEEFGEIGNAGSSSTELYALCAGMQNLINETVKKHQPVGLDSEKGK